MTRLAACTFETRVLDTFDDFAGDVRTALDRAAGADLVVLPELLTLGLVSLTPGWESATAGRELARTTEFTDEYLALFEQEARVRGQHIVAGSHLRREHDRLINVAHVFGPDGLIATHAKTHLFAAEADAGIDEADELGIVELPFGKVGLAICYEVQIPELVTALVERGADIIACPSYTATEAGFWRVRTCVAARCVENQVFALHAGTYGTSFGPVPSAWARASVLGPCHAPWPANGVIAETPANEAAAAIADVSLEALHDNRDTGDVRPYNDRRRRRELYASWRHHASGPTEAEFLRSIGTPERLIGPTR
ncbi:nitrilase-related carbon-nitrogen hydrolase [Conexibacter woesei]|uniref:Nitrilase/cyanide hydratase and apolipoprotein N-acyltransferase n=1 Tax=Conexibacter woesei (strain DSM 14684 / CCUG 47730 / CIP 108061 / JCM 11494 / NBRC 100937 / ID131577) TaxID=469383 RepID=D3F3F4_CONWI|nr:nitrilase-related carbon-nitrogen hydrolase [Conexibacter woesei]ADB52319.1 Nitrilase/cyanide hydratase and apolipoprotein N- acyltransferase [Conexibacter woesei DSM 14684]